MASESFVRLCDKRAQNVANMKHPPGVGGWESAMGSPRTQARGCVWCEVSRRVFMFVPAKAAIKIHLDMFDARLGN